MKKILCLLIVIGTCGLFTQQALAKAGAINLKMNAFKEKIIKDKNGNDKIVLEQIDSAVPGDKIVYVTEFSNITIDTIDSGAIITNRVPKNTQYVPNSAYCDSCDISFSINGNHFDKLQNLRVALPEGKIRPATEMDIRFVRWRLKNALAPKTQGTVGFKIKINQDTL